MCTWGFAELLGETLNAMRLRADLAADAENKVIS